MNLASAVVVYILIWWCVFFASLPFGVRPSGQDGDEVVPGADPGAPADPNLKQKALVTTGVSFALWIVVCAIILSGVVNFRE